MLSTSYADDPELLVRMVTRAMSAPPAPQPQRSPDSVARQARCGAGRPPTPRPRSPSRQDGAGQLGAAHAAARVWAQARSTPAIFDAADDVFYLLVDELDALAAGRAGRWWPGAGPSSAAGRASLRRRCSAGAGSRHGTSPPALASGGTLRGVGVCGGRVRGRVRIVRPETIDDLQPGEILVAEVTDVGYTAAFCYAAAVVTELGGPMSHAAVVAREFGFPCVVDVQGATRSLPSGRTHRGRWHDRRD